MATWLIVRSAGSQIVGLTPFDFSQTTPLGPTLLRPMPVGGFVGGLLPGPGIGPRELPSHLSQPTAHPFENQKLRTRGERAVSTELMEPVNGQS